MSILLKDHVQTSKSSKADLPARMNGTLSRSPLSYFSIAMIQPQFSLNIGYVARTMANFGIRRLFVISDREMHNDRLEEAKRYASHGRKIVEDMNVVNSLSYLRDRFSTLIGTTAIQATRKSNIARKTLDLDYFASKFSVHNANRARSVCIVLGRDTTGLTNDELRNCDYNITIRTGSSYNTLNISHAASIIFYELSKRVKFDQKLGKKTTNNRKERDTAISLFKRLAEDAEFQGFKSQLLSQTLTNLFNRSEPSLREIYLLMGLASKASSKIRRLSPSS